ncbi:META domain-containing protein [Thalassotalea agarivorans]|uniref:Heat shock protein HslJ n=1 Tax=Thalassotalea agarivorans TaxID=349064 RepID=A0A1I0CQH8_THASX|nr:META domain-containing protein [Thalassotalea agarivorans]SET21911.1 Heat shock protein HslJ [Thalassotalea agarivorans]
MKHKFLNQLLVIFGAFLLSACQYIADYEDVSLGEDALAGQEWQLVSLNEQPVAAAEKAIQLAFDKNSHRAHGFSGCNYYSGTYVLEQEAISFAGLASTRKACPDNETNENLYLQMLTQVKGFTVENDQLVLLADNDLVLARFARIAQ